MQDLMDRALERILVNHRQAGAKCTPRRSRVQDLAEINEAHAAALRKLAGTAPADDGDAGDDGGEEAHYIAC